MKILIRVIAVLLMCALFSLFIKFTTFAAEPEVPEDVVVEDFTDVTESEESEESENTLSLDDVSIVFEYTSDSVTFEGLTYKTYSDPISNQTGLEIVPSFGIGYAIYDNPDTEFIDGIRINGNEVTSLRIPIAEDTTVLEYKVAVRTVYVDGASGDLAQILDGTYDYSQLITNPIIIFQLAYWAFMAISGFIGIVTAAKSKSKKVKTSDEIAAKVVENVDVFKEQIVGIVTEVVKAEVLPLAQASVKSGKEAVKAIVLANSKSKEAPAALLDVFKESADLDITSVVDEAYAELSKSLQDHDTKHANNVATLQNIAHNVIQEDVGNATESNTQENAQEEPKSSKSIF